MKPLFAISCPIDTYSGYGARSRDIVKAIINQGEYDVKILPQRWGETAWGFIEDHPEWDFLKPHLLPPLSNQLPKKPEIWCQITVPNEFSPVGIYNIGITAGIETTIASAPWVEGINRMDLNLVSSNHSKNTFLNSTFEQQNPQGQKIGEIKATKPIEVLFEGADLNTYFPKKSEFDLEKIEENFTFLYVGHWLNGELGEDRKNTGMMVKSFFDAFKNKKNPPALILKTSGGRSSYMDREAILNKIFQIRNTIEDAKTFPNVYLLHGDFSNREINELYNHKKVKAMISMTKGEGFGRPLLEFSLTKKPIIATNWSGHIDFLSPQFTSLVSGELTQLHGSSVVKDVLIPESSWFSANYKEFTYCLRDMFENYKGYKEKAVRQAFQSKSNFSFKNMEDQLKQYMDTFLPDFPKPVKLKLPKLKKIELPKLKKVENVEG